MNPAQTWAEIILQTASPQKIWSDIFDHLAAIAPTLSISALQKQLVVADRLLAESAWDLWQAYPTTARHTSAMLQEWWQTPSPTGRAVLILDAFSLRELPSLLAGATAQGLSPTVSITGAEAPTDTDQFAQALGVSSRSKLGNNNTPASFSLGKETYTDILSLPFADCVASLPYHQSHLFIWHTWLDDNIHQHNMSSTQLYKQAPQQIQAEGFWQLVDRLRHGRQLIITSDHGYAESKQFTTEENQEITEALRNLLGASRNRSAEVAWSHHFMPPVVMTANNHHMVMGQRKWKVRGGTPELTHGGLSLLEAAVPFIEFSAKQTGA